MRQLQFTDCVEIVGEACQPFSGYKQYVSTGAVAINHISNDDIELVDYDGKPSRANLIAKSGDILFAKMMGTKKTLHLDEDTAQNIYSTGFCAVRARPTVLTDRCLYHLLTSKAFLDQKDKNCSGATQKAITNAGLSKITIKVPSIGQQASIAQQLDRIASIIALRQSELQKLDELIKARFVEMFGDPVSNDRGWNTAPLETVCKTIVDCPHYTQSYTDVNTGYLCIRTSIVKKNRIMWDEIEYIPEHEYKKRIQRKRPEKGDIVYTREGAILGIAAIIDRECNVALGQRSMLLSPDTTKCLPQFLCVAMNFDTFLRKALKGLSGSASPHINVGDIKAFTIIVPPMELQNQFAVFVEQVDKSKVVVQKALDEAQTLFDSLMQEYFG